MATREVLISRLHYWNNVYEKYQAAYLALIEGGVKNYMIDDRSMTKFDLDKIYAMMKRAESEIDDIEDKLNGRRKRRAFGILPLDT